MIDSNKSSTMRTLAEFEAEVNKRRQTKSNARRDSVPELKKSLARLRGSHKETVEINKMLSSKLADANKHLSEMQSLNKGQAAALETLQLVIRELSQRLESEKEANAELRAKNVALEALT